MKERGGFTSKHAMLKREFKASRAELILGEKKHIVVTGNCKTSKRKNLKQTVGNVRREVVHPKEEEVPGAGKKTALS